MTDEWQQGWQAGFDNASVNSGLVIHCTEQNGEKVFSSYGGGASFPKTFQHRGGMFDRGYAEGMLSGFGKYATKERIAEACKKLGIKYNK